MGPLVILIAQSAAAIVAGSQAAGPPPDIELRAHVEARSVEVRQSGNATLEIHAIPGEAPPIRVERSQPPGESRYRNLRIDLHAIARLTAPEPIAAIETQSSTGDPK